MLQLSGQWAGIAITWAILAGAPVGQAAAQSAAFDGKTVYIVHGYRASSEDHWFEWLEHSIEDQGGEAHRVELPESSAPDPELWQEALDSQLQTLTPDTLIVAHSLGGLSVLSLLSEGTHPTIGGLLLVSSFKDRLPAIPELDGFIDNSVFNAAVVENAAERRLVFASDNDPYVEPALTEAMAQAINAEFVTEPGGGHFLASDGYEQFPQLYERLAEIASASE